MTCICWYAQPHQIPHLRPRPFPHLPDAHPDSVVPLDKLDDPLIIYVFSQQVQKPLVIQRVEVLGQVKAHSLNISLLRIFLHLPNRILRTSPRTIAVTSVREQRLIDGHQFLLMACRMIRSMTVGMPSLRTPPSGFGISTRLTGEGLYLPLLIPCSYWTSTCVAALSSCRASYAVSVRQARGLPAG